MTMSRPVLCCSQLLSHIQLFSTLWTVVHQVPLSMGDSPGKNTGVDSRAFLQGISPTQGLNPGLPHCRWILNHLSHQDQNTGAQESWNG